LTDLVFLTPGGKEPFTTSEVIAEQTRTSRHAVQQLIRTYEEDLADLESNKRVAFEMRTFQTRGGQQEVTVYHLTEQQATLLIAFMKNATIVRAFKKELVRQFFLMREELRLWAPAREALKPVRRELTDAVKEAMPDSKWTYKHFMNLAYKKVIDQNAEQIRKARGGKPRCNATELLDATELKAVTKITYQLAALVELGYNYKEAKAIFELSPRWQLQC